MLPLYTFKKQFKFATFLSVAGGIVFFIFEIKSHLIETKYVIPEGVLSAIQMVNVALALVVILSSVFLYVFIAWLDEHNLEQEVLDKTQELSQKDKKVLYLQSHTVNSLANLVENRDSETGEHIQRTSKYVHLIAQSAYKNGIYKDIVTEEYIEKLTRAAPMHDIGKIVISDLILKKPGPLTEDEYVRIKIHTTEGAKIVKDIIGVSDDKEYLQITEEVAMYHHEKWDGSGYPENLKGEEIPVSARIMAIADVFDALVCERCYKDAIDAETAFKIIEEEAGRHFDPILVEQFLSIKDEILQVYETSGW